MKYTLKGLKFNGTGTIKFDNFDFNLEVEEVQLEGNFEEVLNTFLEIGREVMQNKKCKEEEKEDKIKRQEPKL